MSPIVEVLLVMGLALIGVGVAIVAGLTLGHSLLKRKNDE